MSMMNWIPTTERLPESDYDCLVTSSDKMVAIAFYSFDGKWIYYTKDGVRTSIHVDAWMPLPKPYGK